MCNPLVSIIIPVFNRSHLIKETLQSVKNQFLNTWECIIVDDGSTDVTVDVVADFIKGDNRFLLLVRPDNRKKGASTCRNIGLENSKGRFIQFLDSDDIISPDKISEQLKVLTTQSELSFAFCKWGRFSNSIDAIDLYDSLFVYQDFSNPVELLNALIVSKGYLPIHSFLFSKKLVDKAGFWDENIGLNDDGEFFSRVVVTFDKAVFSERGVVFYRNSEKDISLSSFDSIEKVISSLKSWETIFKRYRLKFKGEDRKFRIYKKKSIYQVTKIHYPSLLKDQFFFELKFYLWRERLVFFFKCFLKKVMNG